MISKYFVEFTTSLGNHTQASNYETDDPVACGDFLENLLERGAKIRTVKHNGKDLPQKEFDGLIKTAAARLASSRICNSLGIDYEEEQHRFGYAA